MTFQVPVQQPHTPQQPHQLTPQPVLHQPQPVNNQNVNFRPTNAGPWNPQQPVHQQTVQLPSQPSYNASHYQYPQDVQSRLRGILPLSDGGATKKEIKVIDFAKKCPAKWAKVAKADNINLPLYSYGAVTELEAALSGRADPMPEGVLLSKLRHLKNTLEVCCLNSAATDFSSYGWVIARDYAMKVEDEVEQRFVAWQDMLPGVRTQTLVLSQMENPRLPPPRKKFGEKEEPNATGRRERCSTFNTCTSEMKCDYEVRNSGKTCLKKHECSWCRTNLQQGFKHQVWKCLKKQAAGQ